MPKGGYQTPAALYAARILSDQAEPKPAPNAEKSIKTATGEAYTERGIQRNKKAAVICGFFSYISLLCRGACPL